MRTRKSKSLWFMNRGTFLVAKTLIVNVPVPFDALKKKEDLEEVDQRILPCLMEEKSER
jgi:hypothetical protein